MVNTRGGGCSSQGAEDLSALFSKLHALKKDIKNNVIPQSKFKAECNGLLPMCIVLLPSEHVFVKLREREGQRVDLGRSLKDHL